MDSNRLFHPGKTTNIGIIVMCVCLIVAGYAESAVTAALKADAASYYGPCPAEMDFKGTITSDKSGKIQYRIKSSDGTLFPVETLEFSGPGTKTIKAKRTFGDPTQTSYEAWAAIEIVYPEEFLSDKATFNLACDQMSSDLTLKIKECPKTARPGQDIGNAFKVKAINRGGISVSDILVDIILKKEPLCPVPAQPAEYSANFHDGVLLKGGRHQVSLNAGQSLALNLNGPNTVPADISPGDYFLCAVIDAGNKIKESNKENNCSCCPLRIAASAAKPDLEIAAFRFRGWGKCEPNQPIFYFEVTVANVGSAPSPAMPDKALVQVTDLPRNDWQSSVGLNSIPPGGRQTVEVPIYYYSKDPAHMTKAVPHPFRAIVDPLRLINDRRDKNQMSDIIYLDPSSVCSGK